MPTLKPLDYTPKQISISLTGRAIGHPGRVKMIELLIKHPKLTNKDLTRRLHLSKSTIHNHLTKLWDAGLINVSYYPHSLCVEMTEEQIRMYRKLEALFDFQSKKAYHLSLLD